ncbi:MAG: ABC transporter ATP-binding protein [Clostridia bacterium]
MPGPMHSKQVAEKPKNMKKALQKLAVYGNKYIKVLIFTLILAAGGAVLTVVGPNQISKITDYISDGLFTGIDLNGIQKVGILLICIYGASALFTFLQHFIMATLTQRVSKQLRSDISGKINRVPLKYFSGNTYGDILSRVTNDVDTIGQALNNSIAPLIAAIAQVAGCVIMMFYTNWIMALSAIFSTIVGFLLMLVIMSHSQRHFIARQNALGKLNGYVEEMYSGHDIVRVSGAEKQIKNKFDGMNAEVREANWKSQFLSGVMQPLMNFIGNFGYLVVCVVGALLVMKDIATIGTIAAFMLYIRLFTSPLSQIAQSMTNLQQAAASSERVFEFLEEEELPDESSKTATIGEVKGEVVFSHVCFSYPDKPDDIIIKDFSVTVKPGQKVAIVGPTGAGKTTLVNLLMRFYDLNSGTILIDGVPISSMKRGDVHRLFGMVLQDTWLFEGTVRENLVYNNPEVPEEDLIRACKACGIYHFIKTLPHGFDTMLDDNTAISSGQKQLFTIARAMIQNSPMLILDEATSSVDTRTELITQQAMDKLTEKRTSFVIAHRLSTIKNADIILVLRDGDIVEQGKHEELLAKGGFYAELYNSQFEQAS